MDETRFDTLARSLGDAHSRRGLTRLLGALSLGAPLALWSLAETEAKRKKKKKKKKGTTPTSTAPPPPPPPAPTCGTGGPCLVFLSSTKYKGNLGGLTGADAKCQQLAQAANLPGTYKAWVSDNTGSPATRFFQSPQPYQLVDGTKVADNYADLIDDSLDAAILRNEFGAALADFFEDVWTNTRSDGTPVDANHHCVNWSSTSSSIGSRIGFFSQTDGSWTSVGTAECSRSLGARLYCFQQS